MTSYDHRKQPGHTVLVLNHQAPGHAVAPGTCLEAMASCAMPCHAMRCREAPAMKCETKARERSERPWRSWSFAETGSHLNPVSTCFNPMVSREDKLGIWCQDSPKNVVLRINPGFIALFGQLRSQVCLCPRHGISTSRHLARLANGRNMSKYSKWKRSILQPLAWPCLVTASSQGSQGSHFRGRKSQGFPTTSSPLPPSCHYSGRRGLPLNCQPRWCTNSSRIPKKLLTAKETIAQHRFWKYCQLQCNATRYYPPFLLSLPFSVSFTHSFTDSQPRPCFNQGHVAAPYLSKCPWRISQLLAGNQKRRREQANFMNRGESGLNCDWVWMGVKTVAQRVIPSASKIFRGPVASRDRDIHGQ